MQKENPIQILKINLSKLEDLDSTVYIRIDQKFVFEKYVPVKYIPILQYPFVREAKNWTPQKIWHPKKIFALVPALRIFSPHLNPNEEQTAVIKFNIKDPKVEKYHRGIFQIDLLKPHKEPKEIKYKVIIASFGVKWVRSGAMKIVAIEKGQEFLVFRGSNISRTGAHLIKWLVFFAPVSEKIKITWKWHGANRTVSEREYEV